jgi:hypothetical protein
MSSTYDNVRHWAVGHQVAAWIAAAVSVAVLALVVLAAVKAYRAVKAAEKGKRISALVNVGAVMATAVQASGMYRFFGTTMGLPFGFRIFMFGFMEVALLATALRARANVEEGGDAGIDGVLVWVLALASGVMSATDAHSTQESVMRVLTSVVVALLWSRDLLAAKQAARKAGTPGGPRETVRWRFNVKEMAVKLGLATTDGSTIAGLDANRRADRYMRAHKRYQALVDAGASGGVLTRAAARMARTEGRLNRHARLHADPTRLMHTLGERAVDEVLEALGVSGKPLALTADTADTLRTDTGAADTRDADTRRVDTVDTRDADTTATDTQGADTLAGLVGLTQPLIPAQAGPGARRRVLGTPDTDWMTGHGQVGGTDTLSGHGTDTRVRGGADTVDTVADTFAGHGVGAADTFAGHGADTPAVSIVPAVSADPEDRSDEALLARLIAEVPPNTNGTVSVRRVKDTLGVSTARAQRLIEAALMLPDPPANPLTDTAEIPAITDDVDLVEVVNGSGRQV